ncbi:MAG: DegT/DnrJ/EryC1/StrS family aminotransferase [Gemmatimonadota bacterium]
MTDAPARIWLSTPHMGGDELGFIHEAFETNWIAPLGPNVDAFEQEFAAAVGARHAVAMSSGTAALLVALRQTGVGPGDEVLVSTLTFVASVSPILELGATPIFLDADPATWNLNPALVLATLRERAARDALPKALVVVHLYGQSADMDPILEACAAFGVPVIEDAAEALGATYRGRAAGTLSRIGIYSFNGNKIITTAGGGMLVTEEAALADWARKLITQAREPAPHYEHEELGYNYRMSNVLAGIGRGQLRVLEDRVAQRRANCAYYQAALGELPGVAFMPEAAYGRCTRWLTCLTIDSAAAGVDREAVRLGLLAENIEARPIWKPMHQQPILRGYPVIGGAVADAIFAAGLCLPSGSNLTEPELERVVAGVRAHWPGR